MTSGLEVGIEGEKMADYNWNERHIITFPEEKITLQQKMFMFTMVKMKQSRH